MGLVLLIATQPLLAQHSGHNMGGMGSGTSVNNDRAMKDMQRMMAVQANDEQAKQLRSWIQSTAALGKQLGDLQQAVTSNPTGESSSALESLKLALNDNNAVHEEFVKNLSAPQRSELKKPVQKLDKTNTSLVRALAGLSSSVSGNKSETKKLRNALRKTKKTVEALQREQQRLAIEMGVKV
jgi:chromosome segregation ATPase